ncbi:MAG: HAD family phosphatase [Clostridia bacterium]|nr:HAD family phosphatase [Clostridia bacterium]
MIKNIIFDFGNVIAKFEPMSIAAHFCEDEKDVSCIIKAVFENWGDIDAGRIEYKDYVEKAKSLVPQRLEATVETLMRDWYKILPPVEGMDEMIRFFKKEGRGIYLLSNAPTYFSQKSKIFEILEIFDGKVFSADIKMSKPNADIFEYLLNKYSLKREECLFIDDLLHNVEGAKACGIEAYHFDGDTKKLKSYILGE